MLRVGTTTDVQFEVADRVALVTISRPQSRNAIARTTIVELANVLEQVALEDVSAVVLTGAGDRAFVSGGDLKDLAEITAPHAAEEMARSMRAVLDRVAALPVPVIAALNGHAIGGGAEVAVAADIRVASDDGRIGFTQSTLGIMPAWGGVERLTELVGRSRALLLLCAGQTVSAQQAFELGLVDVVVDRPGFQECWRSVAAGIATLSPAAAHSIKALVSTVRPATHPATEEAAVRAFAELWVAPDHWRLVEAAESRRRDETSRPGPTLSTTSR